MIAKANKLQQSHKKKRTVQSIIFKIVITENSMIKVKHKRKVYLLG